MSDGVRIGIGITNHGDTLRSVDTRDIAQAVEQIGFDSLWVTDHVMLPGKVTSKYPYSADGDFIANEDGAWFEALTTLAFAAAATRKVRLGVGVCVLGIRDPRLLSQQIATLDCLSGGRVVIGAGTGWLLEEFEILEIPTARRGARLDGSIDMLRAAWTGRPNGGHYGPYRLPEGVRAAPTPLQARLPIWLAGDTDAALNRIVERGDGWYGASSTTKPLPVERVRKIRQSLEERCARIGRDPRELTLALRLGVSRAQLGEEATRRLIDGYVAAGVTNFTIDFSFQHLDRAVNGLELLRKNTAHLA